MGSRVTLKQLFGGQTMESNSNSAGAETSEQCSGTRIPFYGMFLLLLLSLAITRCTEQPAVDERPELHADPGQYAGIYLLQPSRNLHVVTLKPDGTAVSENQGRKELGFVRRDRRMLRIYFQNHDRPVGLFLLDDFQPDDWRGVWDNSTRILRRKQSL